MAERRCGVLVIGGGQAGLAAGFYLKKAGLDFRIVEASARIGDSWRERYESLTLFTPRAFSQLPGYRLDGDPEGYASRDEFADYLQAYARHFQLPVSTGKGVGRLTADAAGFIARLDGGGDIRAGSVVVATGGFQHPSTPELASGFAVEVAQFDPLSYGSPEDVPAGRILVVGDGATGRDISFELAAVRETLLSTGKPRRLFPERLFGRSIWYWLRLCGLMRVGGQSFLGRMMRKTDPFPDRNRGIPAMTAAGVRMVPRLTGAEGRKAMFADGTSVEIDAVVWTVGYFDDFGWIDIPAAKDANGRAIQSEGVSSVPGLYFVGRPWQRNRASALVMGVGDDARQIVGRIGRAATA